MTLITLTPLVYDSQDQAVTNQAQVMVVNNFLSFLTNPQLLQLRELSVDAPLQSL